jgi:F-type H+-transporting ATPase subunit delta
VEHSGGIEANFTASLAGRYASALFDLARDGKVIETVESSLAALTAGLSESADLAALVSSPLVSRVDSAKAIAAVAAAMKLDDLTARFLGVLADNRRLGDLPAMIRSFGAIVAAHRGEVTAEVTTAHPLAADQLGALKNQLNARVGRDVKILTKTDPAILGGLVVKLGSQLIDASIRTRLNTLAQAMKG